MVAAMLNNPITLRGKPLRKRIYGGSGPPATLTCELGQAWKGAAAAGDVCAGMWLGLPPFKKAVTYVAAFAI